MEYNLYRYKKGQKFYFRGYKEATFYTDILTTRKCQAVKFTSEEIKGMSKENSDRWEHEQV